MISSCARMNWSSWSLIGLLFIAHISASNAQTRADKVRDAIMGNGRYFLEGCRHASTNPFPDEQLLGSEYCRGTVETVVRVGPLLPPTLRFCPADIADRQLPILIVVRYVERNPATNGEKPLYLVAIDALREVWPCR